MREPSGLRARKKAMTRQSIADITLRLTLAKGLTNVTTAEIGHEAFVSTRTVTNYFSHKEQAIAAAGNLSTIDIVDRLMERSEAENPLLSLNRVMIDLVKELTPDQLEIHRQKLELAETYPVVKAFLAASYLELEESLAAAIASRIDTDVSAGVYPRMLAAASVAAFRLSLELWAASETDAYSLAETINTLFSTIQLGFLL